jgi:hypothetical protein
MDRGEEGGSQSKRTMDEISYNLQVPHIRRCGAIAKTDALLEQLLPCLVYLHHNSISSPRAQGTVARLRPGYGFRLGREGSLVSQPPHEKVVAIDRMVGGSTDEPECIEIRVRAKVTDNLLANLNVSKFGSVVDLTAVSRGIPPTGDI